MTAQAIANLPDQCDIYARHFAQYKELFENGIFGPTQEKEQLYKQVPPHHEMCSWKDFGQQDPITSLVIRHMKAMNTRLNALLNWLSSKQKEQQRPMPQQYIKLETVLLVMDFLAGFYVPLLSALCLGVLSCIKSEKARIVVLGVFAVVLTTSLILCIPNLRRCDLFAVTAAFFAVGGVYIGAKGGYNN